jgi:subtilisin family serine protease
MKLSISFLVIFLLLSSHFNFAEGGKKEANEKGKRDTMEARKDAEKGINKIFLRGDGEGNDVSDLDDAEGDYIVVFKENKIKNEKTEADFLTRKAKGKLKKTYAKALQGFSARLTRKAINELQNNPHVDYIEEDVQVKINDCIVATQNPVLSWGLDRIDFAVTTQSTSNLDSTYSYVVDGPAQDVHVYVIDTGINSGHDEFVGRRLGEHFGAIDNVPEASDGTFTSGSWEDCHGHGTHVAGTVGGTQYGVAKNANIILHAVRVLDCEGSGYMSDIIEAYDWVIQQCTNQICVANGSFAASSMSQVGNDGAASLVEAGIVYAVAAGNDNVDACTTSPASAEGVITVGATTQIDVRSYYSNYGECLDIFAPVRTQVGIFLTEIVSILLVRA